MKTLREVAHVAFLLLLRQILAITARRQHLAFLLPPLKSAVARIESIPELLIFLTRRLLL